MYKGGRGGGGSGLVELLLEVVDGVGVVGRVSPVVRFGHFRVLGCAVHHARSVGVDVLLAAGAVVQQFSADGARTMLEEKWIFKKGSHSNHTTHFYVF